MTEIGQTSLDGATVDLYQICTLYTAVVSKCMYIIIPWREVLVPGTSAVFCPGPGTRDTFMLKNQSAD